jgi:hypothetical protein
MRHFYTRAMVLKQNKGSQELIDADLLNAASTAEKIAPYRFARLSAVKLAGDPNKSTTFKDVATAAELRAEIMRRLAVLQEYGVLDLKALPEPKRKNNKLAGE